MQPRGLAAAFTPLFLAVSAPFSCASAAPSCLPPVEIAHAKIVRVERNGVLVLADGRRARLEGLILPAGAADHAPDFYADAATHLLSELVVGHTVALAAAAPKQDRYGRLRAQVILSYARGASWLQAQMLEDGFARVAIAPDRLECAAELYAAEAHARERRSGIWHAAAYRVRTPQDAANDVDTFQIVEGTVTRVSQSAGRVYFDFGQQRQFAGTISAEDLRNFRRIGVDPFGYAGQTVRLRGWVERVRRPEIELAVPQDIEVIDAPALRGTFSAE